MDPLVTESADLRSHAAADFPGSSTDDGRPSLSDFLDGPLAAAKLAFAREFDNAPMPVPGVAAIRQWDTMSKVFGPLIFFAVRVGERIEVVDYIDDPDYWETVGDDPLF